MYADITKPAPPLPTAQIETLRPGVSVLPPLSRRGHGPGLIILTGASQNPLAFYEGVPSPLVKWAEEGYTVVQLEPAAFEGRSSDEALKEAATALAQSDKCEPKDRIALVAYAPDLWRKAASVLGQVPSIVASILYTDAATCQSLPSASIPTLRHIAGQNAQSPAGLEHVKQYCYPQMKSHDFATPGHDHFHYITESLSHTRNLQFLKPLMNGPYFDLEAIWEEHTYYEFADRSVDHTMSTMVQEPYVNHVPTLTGGIGRGKLTSFYRNNFIFSNSADAELELISRTIGIDRVVDEFIFKFTHDQQVDWLLPGVPPTNLKAEIPFTAVVNIRGDRLYHEHISWDQGTALRQLGLLPEYLPFPYALPDGRGGGPGGSGYEYRLPVAGKESAEKMRDRHGVPSNEMIQFQTGETDKAVRDSS